MGATTGFLFACVQNTFKSFSDFEMSECVMFFVLMLWCFVKCPIEFYHGYLFLT